MDGLYGLLYEKESAMAVLLGGAGATGSLASGLFSLRFWRTSGKRCFLYFALSSLIDGGRRIYVSLTPGMSKHCQPDLTSPA